VNAREHLQEQEFETRSTKSETKPNVKWQKYQSPGISSCWAFGFLVLDLFRIWDFGFRDFNWVAAEGRVGESAMAVRIKKSTSLEVLNMTPIIDVVFQLLLFFLVATRFAAEDRELDVMLPAASEAKPLTAQPQELFVNIDHQGRYFLHGKIVSGDEVAQILRQAAADNPASQSVIIRADKRVQLDSAVFVMNACNQAGIFDYTLTTSGEDN